MDISYSYEVVHVDSEARCMEIIYSADGLPTVRIGARLPFEGESLSDVVAMYAPVQHWRELQMPTVSVEVGASGVAVSSDAPAQSLAESIVARRNILLYKSDWTQVLDSPLSTEQRQAWASYRQQLRDITDQPGFPETASLPQEPGVQVTVL